MDEMFERLLNDISKMAEASKKVIADRISVPFGYYDIQTGPALFTQDESNWITVVAVTTAKNSKHYGPIEVELYPDEEAAKIGHDTWRRSIMDTAPLMLKDATTGELTFVAT